MRLNFNATKAVAASLLLGVVLAGCSSGPPTPSPQLLQRIVSAHTPGDHESLAKYYEGEATSARTRAVEHRKMAKAYQGVATGGKGGSYNMPRYHDSLATQADNSATDFDKLAADHRQMAATAKP
jgi:outer membrane murein-binding lipoprotein Lpp